MPKTQLKGKVDCTPEVYWYEAAVPKVKDVPRLSLEISTQCFDGKNSSLRGARITLQAELDTLVFDFENLEATQTAAQAKLGDAHMSTWINSLGPDIQGRGI